jgi:hypothetical protein
MILSSNIIINIAKDFAQFKEVKRAKKLIFYISQRYWETDPSIIDSYAWEALLQSIYNNNPTIEDLKALLSDAVNSLNRKEIYLKIAQYTLQRMAPLYQEAAVKYESEIQNEVDEFDGDLMERIVENINYHDQATRIKKLIFAVCKQYWENDINVIDMYDLSQIIREIRQLYPTTTKLRKALENIVTTINRQNVYSFIADILVEELADLYRYESINLPRDEENEEEEQTILILSEKAKLKPQLAELTKEKEKAGIREDVSPKSDMGTKSVESNFPEEQAISWLTTDNLFDLKQEIVQYTNPLRAKIMLFYAVYQIDIQEQHWSIVRTCSLDDLLVKTLHHYEQNINDIEADMMAIANSRIEGLEPDDNIQAVSAIIDCIKRFYQKHSQNRWKLTN